jgi:hypothetical protein
LKGTRDGLGSGSAEPADRRHLAHEQVDDLGIPLVPGALDEKRASLVDRQARTVRAVVDKRVERVADGDDAGKSRDLSSVKPVGIAATIEVLVVVADDRQQSRC